MALIDDINALPTTVGDGNTGHLNNHQVIHAALKDHETRLGARTYTGTGTPVGRISAPIGSIYVDTAATTGAVRWIKASGTNSDGWIVEYGDTGWRDVTNMLTPAPTGGTMRIRMTPENIFINLNYIASGTTNLSANLPSGWSPQYSTGGIIADAGGDKCGHYRITFAGGLAITKTTSASPDCQLVIPRGNRVWPTSAPGTPA